MNRTERIAAILWTNCAEALELPESATELATLILAIADDRRLMGPSEIQDYTGRSKTTVQSWYRRGSHHFPPATWTLSSGPVWDAEVVQDWALRHPEALGPGSMALADYLKAQGA
jgi:hypothetical protein